MVGRVERAAAGAVRGWIVALTVIGVVGWMVLVAVGVGISSGRALFWIPTLLFVALIVPNLLLVRHALSTWREGGATDERSGLPLILFALAVAAAAYLVGLVPESDPGDTSRLVAIGWGTVAFVGQILFLRALPGSDPPA